MKCGQENSWFRDKGESRAGRGSELSRGLSWKVVEKNILYGLQSQKIEICVYSIFYVFSFCSGVCRGVCVLYVESIRRRRSVCGSSSSLQTTLVRCKKGKGTKGAWVFALLLLSLWLFGGLFWGNMCERESLFNVSFYDMRTAPCGGYLIKMTSPLLSQPNLPGV